MLFDEEIYPGDAGQEGEHGNYYPGTGVFPEIKRYTVTVSHLGNYQIGNRTEQGQVAGQGGSCRQGQPTGMGVW